MIGPQITLNTTILDGRQSAPPVVGNGQPDSRPEPSATPGLDQEMRAIGLSSELPDIGDTLVYQKMMVGLNNLSVSRDTPAVVGASDNANLTAVQVAPCTAGGNSCAVALVPTPNTVVEGIQSRGAVDVVTPAPVPGRESAQTLSIVAEKPLKRESPSNADSNKRVAIGLHRPTPKAVQSDISDRIGSSSSAESVSGKLAPPSRLEAFKPVIDFAIYTITNPKSEGSIEEFSVAVDDMMEGQSNSNPQAVVGEFYNKTSRASFNGDVAGMKRFQKFVNSFKKLELQAYIIQTVGNIGSDKAAKDYFFDALDQFISSIQKPVPKRVSKAEVQKALVQNVTNKLTSVSENAINIDHSKSLMEFHLNNLIMLSQMDGMDISSIRATAKPDVPDSFFVELKPYMTYPSWANTVPVMMPALDRKQGASAPVKYVFDQPMVTAADTKPFWDDLARIDDLVAQRQLDAQAQVPSRSGEGAGDHEVIDTDSGSSSNGSAFDTEPQDAPPPAPMEPDESSSSGWSTD
ncbi:hypothetical protein HOH87_01140 [bacterium]|jgi:hypothetical protein|nr:hypothetical protein [bacterium]